MSIPNISEQNIRYKPYMAGLLRRLQAARALVCIQIDKDATLYNSMVIDVLANEEQLFIDELNSSVGHERIKKGTTLHFDGRLKGVRVQFSTQVLSVEDSNSIAMYRLAFPNKLIYLQRRRHYRASVNSEDLAITMPMPMKHKIRGQVIDISASGLCTRLDYKDSNTLETEQAIFDATISLPGSNYITCDIEVRSVRHYPEHGYSLVGSEFIGIPPNQKAHVERIVAMLDRNQRRENIYSAAQLR